MSPEILSNIHYNYKADIWSLGVLLYEMTQKSMPFLAKNMYELNYKINQGRIEFKKPTIEAFKSIIRKCLQHSCYKRISIHSLMQVPEIKAHFVQPVDQSLINFNQMNVPLHTRDWPNAIRNLPCRTTPDPVTLENKIKKANFMDHYTKSQLIHLNNKLLEQIYQKNEHILQLEKQLNKFKHLILK